VARWLGWLGGSVGRALARDRNFDGYWKGFCLHETPVLSDCLFRVPWKYSAAAPPPPTSCCCCCWCYYYLTVQAGKALEAKRSLPLEVWIKRLFTTIYYDNILHNTNSMTRTRPPINVSVNTDHMNQSRTVVSLSSGTRRSLTWPLFTGSSD